MMAKFPAPMASWSAALPTVIDAILAALARRCPTAFRPRTMGTLGDALTFFGNDPSTGTATSSLQSIEGGGWGGRPCEDGPSASVSICQGDVRNAPIETIELKRRCS